MSTGGFSIFDEMGWDHSVPVLQTSTSRRHMYYTDKIDTVTEVLIPCLVVIGIRDDGVIAFYPRNFGMMDSRYWGPFLRQKSYLYHIVITDLDAQTWRRTRLIDRRTLLMELMDQGKIDFAKSKQIAVKTHTVKRHGEDDDDNLSPSPPSQIQWHADGVVEWETLP